MKIKIIKPATLATDKATGLKGRIFHLHVALGGGQSYGFKVSGVHPESGALHSTQWLPAERFTATEHTEAEIPIEVLGSIAEETLTGMKGMVTGLTLHPNGCLHLTIQRKGKLKSGHPMPPYDADMRECIGPAITKLSASAKAKSKEEKPSPMVVEPFQR